MRLLLVDAQLELFQAAGFDVDHFEANAAVGVQEFPIVLGAGGVADVPVTLTRNESDPDGVRFGLNHIVAVIEDPADGITPVRTGPTSNLIVVHYVPEPGQILMLVSGVSFLALIGRRRIGR